MLKIINFYRNRFYIWIKNEKKRIEMWKKNYFPCLKYDKKTKTTTPTSERMSCVFSVQTIRWCARGLVGKFARLNSVIVHTTIDMILFKYFISNIEAHDHTGQIRNLLRPFLCIVFADCCFFLLFDFISFLLCIAVVATVAVMIIVCASF